MRRTAQLAVLGTAIAACNALTGVGELSEEEAQTVLDAGHDAPLVIPTATATSTTTSQPPPPPPPPDSGVADADADADATTGPPDSGPPDTGAPDTYVPPPVCNPATAGPRYGTIAETTSLGQPNWDPKNGARAPNDNSYVHTNAGPGSPNKNTLTVKDFTFALPSNAVIKGIEVTFHRTAEGIVTDGAVSLIKGTPKSGMQWPAGSYEGPYVASTYGSATDLWGTSWIADDVNSSAFAVSLRADGNGDGHLDAIGVTVHYCVPE